VTVLEHRSKTLNVRQAAFIGVGAMVGAGIFSLLGAAGEVAGPAWVSFAIAGAIALLQGDSFAKFEVRSLLSVALDARTETCARSARTLTARKRSAIFGNSFRFRQVGPLSEIHGNAEHECSTGQEERCPVHPEAIARVA